VAAFLRSQLVPGESLVAVQRRGPIVTDRRVLFAWDGYPSGWRFDAVAFQEVTGWSLGHRHDMRPLLRLEHPTHIRTERVPARHFLWFAWGNAEREILHDDVRLPFGTEREPAFQAIFERLRHLPVPRGDDFVVSPRGARGERLRGSVAVLRRPNA
jgi:hypothetical protein